MLLRNAIAGSRKAVGAGIVQSSSSNKAAAALQVVPRTLSSSTAGKESYSDRQARTGRPVSPHVTIYKFPIGALTSIATRVTGGALTVGLTGVSLLALGGADVPSLMSSLGNSMVGVPAKVLLSFPLIYHYGSGLRHFLWDHNPNLLHNRGVAEASYILLGSTVAASLAAGFVTLSALPDAQEKKK